MFLIKFIKFIFHRSFLVAALMVLQLAILMALVWNFTTYYIYFHYLFLALAMVIVGGILNNGKSNPTYKIAWIIIILVMPIFGGLFYVVFGRRHLSKRERRKMTSIDERIREAFVGNTTLEEVRFTSRTAAAQSGYIQRTSLCPPYTGTKATYFPLGEDMFEALKIELKKAKRYIFMEYFIIERGLMWDSILEILKEKVAAGVEVRIIYDDVGCMFKLPKGYYKTLSKLGINCRVFNPLTPALNSRFNNRDHRKITVIDGCVGFTGGINLADEYINAKVVYGHWKDTAVMLKGTGVFSLSVMFLSLWDYLANGSEDYRPYMHDAHSEHYQTETDGFIQPYYDSPLDDEPVGQNVYLNLIYKAKKYVYINTPYLIIDNETTAALCLAAKGGIDVRIVTPHVPDKRYVFAVTRAYYEILVESGVKIYEYTPGFMHAKSFVVDGVYAVVGTINMDFRSLYLHFECGVWMVGAACIKDICDDYLKTLEVCEEITLEKCRAVPFYKRLWRMLLRAFSPLM